MKITKELWDKVNILLTNKRLSRKQLTKLLNISEQLARQLLFAYDNKKIINYEIEKRKIFKKETVLWISDLHIPFENKQNIEIALNYIKHPDKIILGGDIIDFYKISSFLKNPKQRNINEEIKIAKDFLRQLRNRFSDSEIIYIEGNHEYRIERYIIKNAVELYEVLENFLPDKLGLKNLRIEYKRGVFRLGKLWFMHGHEVNVRNYNVEYITNVMWKRIHDNFICGHWHRTQDKIWKSIGGKHYGGFVVGGLCLDMDYMPINNWNNGFAIIYFDDKGYFKVENKKIIEGEIV